MEERSKIIVRFGVIVRKATGGYKFNGGFVAIWSLTTIDSLTGRFGYCPEIPGLNNSRWFGVVYVIW